MNDNIIEFHNISKSYGDNVIIPNLNLNIKRGDFLTVIGSSGCGKTTMLKMINRLITPDKGEILINGKNIKDIDVVKLRRQIGYSIQGNMLFPHLTIAENVYYVPDLIREDEKNNHKNKNIESDEAYNKNKKEKLSILMKHVGLDDSFLNRFPHELSGGQQQRVGIARAIAAEPKLLLMDEPFGAIDEITRSQLQKQLKDIYNQFHQTIIFVTHDIGEALFLGQHVLVINHGVIDQYGTPSDILNNPATDFVKKLCERTRVLIDKKNNKI
ncbi:glycine/betaine ABC transporter ATP-binding protein [Methanobrevibacter sp. 87.7]|uniref:ATP-binding cassette domain-containing protein n=1 Tax=Methanobrevibacter sp. 87.7 TaxID=387957 RepID=UPI000B50A6D3|nr:ABC transporter ATP-binding protein [Methanobrevibacter sp. 87.7]OWT33831.1 glycine/betaine ABC transporter ATP-binding protein [Methanobrevibacter sp. 87.7]